MLQMLTLLVFLIPAAVLAADTPAQDQDNAAIAATPCESLKNPLNKTKLDAIDVKYFADWFLSRMEEKYPKKDVATFKHHVLSYEPVSDNEKDKNPFVFLSAMACTDGKALKAGAYGDNLEQSLLWMLDQRAAYFEQNKNKGK